MGFLRADYQIQMETENASRYEKIRNKRKKHFPFLRERKSRCVEKEKKNVPENKNKFHSFLGNVRGFQFRWGISEKKKTIGIRDGLPLSLARSWLSRGASREKKCHWAPPSRGTSTLTNSARPLMLA